MLSLLSINLDIFSGEVLAGFSEHGEAGTKEAIHARLRSSYEVRSDNFRGESRTAEIARSRGLKHRDESRNTYNY